MKYTKPFLLAAAACMLSTSLLAQDLADNSSTPSSSLNTKPTTKFKYTQSMPKFIGSLSRFLARNLQYPQECIERHQEGRAVMEFLVLESGLITDVRIKESSGFHLLDNEAMRVTKLMEEKAYWKPASQNGVTVKATYDMPVTFELQ